MSKHNAYLKDESLLTLFSLNNLIVPEIQREYVWGNNTDVLSAFLSDIRAKAAPCTQCHHVHTDRKINVGFLYTYKPPYVHYENERFLDEYLIDGQQRLTTLFLLLLYRASVEHRMDDFLAICRFDDDATDMGFNYKVRSLTQRFVRRLIQHAKDFKPVDGQPDENAFSFVSNIKTDAPNWLLSDYLADPTVGAMLKALKVMIEVFRDDDNLYFDYLLSNIRFWHFKTDITSQGEELYITMNSRGEQLSGNEVKKSRVLPNKDLKKYGKEWEEWQTYFWRNRHRADKKKENENADKGFNNFLDCIESYASFHDSDCAKDVAHIGRYIEALQYISDKLPKNVTGLYMDWYETFIGDLWNEINVTNSSWEIINPKTEEERKKYNNQSAARNKVMLFWPWMHYWDTLDGQAPDDLMLTRLLHLFYVRFHCYKRGATSVKAVGDSLIGNNGLVDINNTTKEDEDDDSDNTDHQIFSKEERRFSELISNTPVNDKDETERLIWQLQDLPYLLDGRDVGGDTFLNMADDAAIVNPTDITSSLQRLNTQLRIILPPASKDYIEVKRCLLFYKDKNDHAFWKQLPSQYSKYETSSWKRIVRTQHFLDFYKEIVASGKDVPTFLAGKQHDFFAEMRKKPQHPLSHRRLCILYDTLNEESIWTEELPNILFEEDEKNKEGFYPGQDRLYRIKERKSNNEIKLNPNWKTKARNV